LASIPPSGAGLGLRSLITTLSRSISCCSAARSSSVSPLWPSSGSDPPANLRERAGTCGQPQKSLSEHRDVTDLVRVDAGLLDLDALMVFVAEHQRCGDLDSGTDNGYVWIQCSCGGLILQPTGEQPTRPTDAWPA
jgi:hypothetical protein